jgi:hypothetical protein
MELVEARQLHEEVERMAEALDEREGESLQGGQYRALWISVHVARECAGAQLRHGRWLPEVEESLLRQAHALVQGVYAGLQDEARGDEGR